MTSHLPERRVSVAALILALALAAACSSSNPASPGSTPAVNQTSTTSPGTGSSSTGTLRVMLKDSPGDAKAVLVTFTQVAAHKSGSDSGDAGEWVDLSKADFTRTCDLMKLKITEDVLVTGLVAGGHYTQIRLLMPDVVLYTVGESQQSGPACVPGTAGAATDLIPVGATPEQAVHVVVPSGDIKLNREFDVPPGGATTITLDFDADKSIHKTGNGKYMMTPVIAVSVQ